MNKPLLRKIKKHILEEPKRFFMSEVCLEGEPGEEFYSDNGRKQKFAKCGTAACIAGWACLLSGETYTAMDKAEELLGITEQQGTRLFLEGNWPEKFQDAYDEAKTEKRRAEIAAKRIDYFITTGK